MTLEERIKAIREIGKNPTNRISKMKKHIANLDKENAELDCQKNRNKFCYSCANATKRCFTNEIGCPCEKYKSYKETNAELKEQIEKMKNRCNCKNGWYSTIGRAGFGCNLNIIKCAGCKHWEMKE